MSKTFNKPKNITTQDQARQYAIDWQNCMSDRNLSYRELVEWQEIFTVLAKKFNLVEEFQENGII